MHKMSTTPRSPSQTDILQQQGYRRHCPLPTSTHSHEQHGERQQHQPIPTRTPTHICEPKDGLVALAVDPQISLLALKAICAAAVVAPRDVSPKSGQVVSRL